MACAVPVHNRRTFKRRVQKLIAMSVSVTAIIFTVIAAAIAFYISKSEASMVCSYFSKSTAKEMSSAYFLKQMGISSIQQLDGDSAAFQDWSMNFNDNIRMLFEDDSLEKHLSGADMGNIELSAIQVNIELNGKQVFDSHQKPTEPRTFISRGMDSMPEIAQLSNSISAVQTSCDILSSDGAVVGRVTAVFEQQLLAVFLLTLIVLVCASALIVMIIGSIVSKIFSILVTAPLTQLERQVAEVATADAVTFNDVQLKIKRPLREIESIIRSTNTIMRRMQHNTKMLEQQNSELDAQKETLEQQKETLEAQNDQLARSKEQIEHAQTQLIQSANLASVGQLTAAITHEINTPLGAISSNSQIIDMVLGGMAADPHISADDTLKESLQSMKESNDISIMACRRMTDIIQSLKTYSRLDQAEYIASDLDENMRSVLVLTSNLWKNRVQIETEYGIGEPVKCYPGLMNQVFMNLVVNAIQSIDGPGSIHIKTWIEGSSAFVAVQDSGCGIAPENLSRIFDLGFTTKTKAHGMGMGLSICKNIVERHNGSLTVKSEPGNGTVFLVQLPVAGAVQHAVEGV